MIDPSISIRRLYIRMKIANLSLRQSRGKRSIMTRFLIPLLFFVQCFTDSICTPIVCGDLSLRHVFLLVPPTSELPELTKFLANMTSATLLRAPEDDGLVQVICDSKDWEEVYRYTLDRNLRPIHTAFCINQGDFSSLDELRKHKPKTPGRQNSLETSERRNVRDVEETEDVNSRVLRSAKRKKVSRGRQADATTKSTVRKGKKVGKRDLDGVDRFYEDEDEKIVSRRAANKKKAAKKARKGSTKKDGGEEGEATAAPEEGDTIIERSDDSEDTTTTGEEVLARKKGKGKKKPPKVRHGKHTDYEEENCEGPVTPDLLGELGGYLRNIVNWVKKIRNRQLA